MKKLLSFYRIRIMTVFFVADANFFMPPFFTFDFISLILFETTEMWNFDLRKWNEKIWSGIGRYEYVCIYTSVISL